MQRSVEADQGGGDRERYQWPDARPKLRSTSRISSTWGGFGRDSAFEAKAEDDGVLIRLVRSGPEKRVVQIHLHHFLLANILEELAVSLEAREPIDNVHREPLLEAARRFAAALKQTPANCG